MHEPAWDVIGIGENSVDFVYRLPMLPGPNSKIPITGRRISPGGQVATTLCACASFGLRASYVGAFGSDENGARIRRELERRGVQTGNALVREGANRCAIIMVDERTGDRIVLWERDPALALGPADLQPAAIAGTRLLHVDATDEELSIAAARAARQAGVLVTSDIDVVTDRTEQLIAAVDAAILAQHVPESLTGEADVERALRTLRGRHPQWLCVTRGEGGAVLLDGNRLHRSPAFPVEAIDTTGAGDVFRAGFIRALLRGDAPDDILRFANAAAAVSCTRPGAIESVPSLQDVERVLTSGKVEKWKSGKVDGRA